MIHTIESADHRFCSSLLSTCQTRSNEGIFTNKKKSEGHGSPLIIKPENDFCHPIKLEEFSRSQELEVVQFDRK